MDFIGMTGGFSPVNLLGGTGMQLTDDPDQTGGCFAEGGKVKYIVIRI